MTRIFVQRGSSAGASSSSSSTSNPSRSSSSSSSSAPRNEPSSPTLEESQDQAVVRELVECSQIDDENKILAEGISAAEAVGTDDTCAELPKGFGGLSLTEKGPIEATDLNVCPMPPPPPVPPPKPCAFNSNPRRLVSGSSNTTRIGPSRRPLVAWPVISTRTSPTGSRPSSPRSHSECEGYNSADEQSPCFVSSYDDVERERQFEIEIRRAKGFEVKKMVEDGNCLFRGVADQVYGDSELYDLARQMCIDYMERERDHFSQFITEGFTTYCKRKRRDKVYGNNVEIQALSEMYNRPIHIYSYSTEPINIFHGSYDTDSPPIRLSYHHGNHYNSLVDPRRVTIGAGLGFSCLGANVDKEKIKAAIAAQQDEQIENALVAEGRLYSDIELTEKEIERMVVAISRAEYIVGEGDNERKLQQQQNQWSSSSSNNINNQPSSSSSSSSSSNNSSVVSLVVSMGFNYLQVMEAYSLFGEDADSIVCYLLETTATRRKGKAAES